MPEIERFQFQGFSAEAFSQGKTAKDPNQPQKNEDRYFVSQDYVAVVDGATTNPPIIIEGKTSGAFAASSVIEALLTARSGMSGQELIDYIAQHFQNTLNAIPSALSDLDKSPMFTYFGN